MTHQPTTNDAGERKPQRRRGERSRQRRRDSGEKEPDHGRLHYGSPSARSSGDRARASGARGRRFESSRAHSLRFARLHGGNHVSPVCPLLLGSVLTAGGITAPPGARSRLRDGKGCPSRGASGYHGEHAGACDDRPSQYRCRACHASVRAAPVMPSARRRARRTHARGAPQDGLTWIHLEAPTHEEVQVLATRFGWHPLDVEDVLSRRERPEGRRRTPRPKAAGYLLRRPPLPGLRRERRPAERGRARRLRRPRLSRHAADRRAEAGLAALRALRRQRGASARASSRADRAASSTRCSTTSTTTASRSSTRSR